MPTVQELADAIAAATVVINDQERGASRSRSTNYSRRVTRPRPRRWQPGRAFRPSSSRPWRVGQEYLGTMRFAWLASGSCDPREGSPLPRRRRNWVAYKLMEAAQSGWRAGNAHHLVAFVRVGAIFVDGIKVESEDPRSAA